VSAGVDYQLLKFLHYSPILSFCSGQSAQLFSFLLLKKYNPHLLVQKDLRVEDLA